MWRALQSRHLHGIDYDPAEPGPQHVNVQFLNGAVYRTARPIPRSVLDSWLQSPSPGAFFHAKIKPDYGMMKVADGTTRAGRRSSRRY